MAIGSPPIIMMDRATITLIAAKTTRMILFAAPRRQ
jgi:hypothetical protein